MARFDDLMDAVNNDQNMKPLIKEMIYLEGELDRLRELPKLMVNPHDPQFQKATPAAKQYKEFLQQYVNIVKVVLRASGADQVDDESPLRKWMNAHVDH